MFHDDIAPELHDLASRPHARMHLSQELEIDALGTARFTSRLGTAVAEIDGFVEPDVELVAREVG
jgi:hypothetical protein